MTKIPLSDNSGRWFDRDSAKEFKASSFVAPSGEEVCRATGSPHLWEKLYLTQEGGFVLLRWCDRYDPEAEGVIELDRKSAVQWLIANGHQDELKGGASSNLMSLKELRGRACGKLDLEPEESKLKL